MEGAMENYIIIGVVLLLVAVGAYFTIRHFKGQGGCCGEGGYKPRRKKIHNVIAQKTFLVEGMHCKHCKARVEEAVADIHGVAGRVDLKKGVLTVYYAQPVEDEVIYKKIRKAGYIAKKQ